MELTVSILIDNYNYGRFLGQAIDSALAQTYPHVEVVVVDDGSTDNSREIIASYGNKIRAVLKKNGGQGSAFNAGFAAAQGEIVALMDSDDFYGPNAAEKIVSHWGDEVNILHHRLRTVDSEGNLIGYSPPLDCALDGGNVVPALLKNGYYQAPPTTGLAYRRAFLDKILPIPESDFRISADAYLFLVSPFLSPVVVVDETLAYYRFHQDNAILQTSQRRTLTRRKLEATYQSNRRYYALLKRLADERGISVPHFRQWGRVETFFEQLLYFRASAPADWKRVAGGFAELWKKIWSERSTSVLTRFRRVGVALMIGFAPLFVLRRVYPHIFNVEEGK
jgi:glycosyltransferase involved in cell wall biosynthesis